MTTDETSQTPSQQPNVLFIICDQMRADHVGFAGNTVVRTPNIDRIANGGTVFDRAYVSNPVCMPSRSTLMTGRMPSAHGVIFNDRSLDPAVNTFVHQLRKSGWRTALIGKSHLQHGMSRHKNRGKSIEPGYWSPHEPGWDTVEHIERYEAGEVVDPENFYGFDHIQLTIGHGAWSGGHHYQWARDLGVSHEQLTCGLDPHADIPGRSDEWWQLYPAPFPDEASSTSFVTERTIKFIEEAAADDDPWMAWCSFPDPHHPMSPPEPWFSRHDPDDIELPASYDDPGIGWPEHVTRIRETAMDPERPYVQAFGPTPEQLRGAIAATYGMIEAIDSGIGKIVRALERLDIADNTIIVFTADHGDMMGDHGLILKGAMSFEACTRVAMVVNTPDGTGQRTQSLASSIDLPHTVLDLCGVPEYQGMQGHSLTPIIGDASITVRDHVLIEDDFPIKTPFWSMPTKTRSLITDDHRLTKDSNGFVGLYNLTDDPHELTNLSVTDTDGTVEAEMFAGLVDAMMHADDTTLAHTERPEWALEQTHK